MPTDRRSPYHHGDLPAALLAAVGRQVASEGVAAVTLRRTARLAGVSHAAPAHHFGDKRGLLTAFARQGQELLAAEIEQGVAAAQPGSRQRLAAIAVAYVRFGVRHAAHFAVISRPDVIDADDADLRAVGQPNFDRLLVAVREHQEAGWRAERPPRELAVMLWSAVHGLVDLWLSGLVDPELKEGGVEPFAVSLVELLLDVGGPDGPVATP